MSPDTIIWETLDPVVASVTRGVVTGLAPGLAIIQAGYQGTTVTMLVDVG